MDLNRWRWDESLALGVDELDDDHRHFGGLVQTLDDAVAAGAEKAIIDGQMKMIAADALRHFENENGMLEKYAYPYRVDHEQLHKEVGELLKRLVFGTNVLSPERLKALLVGHLLHEDMSFGAFLRARFE